VGLKETAIRVEKTPMDGLLNLVIGVGVAVAVVVAFWVFLDFIYEMQKQTRRH
jgi:hypothetical protein